MITFSKRGCRPTIVIIINVLVKFVDSPKFYFVTAASVFFADFLLAKMTEQVTQLFI